MSTMSEPELALFILYTLYFILDVSDVRARAPVENKGDGLRASGQVKLLADVDLRCKHIYIRAWSSSSLMYVYRCMSTYGTRHVLCYAIL